ncbi:MAG: fasciclin domain-containing protein [Prolixibacteraceae bacterium]|nr:fasciclin domain-containing protein [Prolixibacteraceae bacterium]
MSGKKLLFYFIGLLFFQYSCKQDEFDKYDRPDWLAGKVYTQIKAEENLSVFAKCLELTGYDKVVDVSGSYTVFAPTNEAFDIYFQSQATYSSVEDIPEEKLLELVKFHILQNPWSRSQLRKLDVNGWIDPDDELNDEPRGFKRETLLLLDDIKVGVQPREGAKDELIIVDTTLTDWHRRVITDSRKYAPIFYSEFFGIYDLPLSDYNFYFGRNFDNADDMYYVNARLVGDEIFAENGFVHPVDRVVEPLKNANELLRANDNGNNYSKFLDLVNQFPSFSYNQDETNNQAGASEGLMVDSLFDLTYPDLTFNITGERTKAPAGGTGFPENVSIRFHHGLIAPTNEAFDQFVEQYIAGGTQWGTLENTPNKIKRIIANSYFSANPIFESDIQSGFYNGETDIIYLDQSSIVQKYFGSNCTFLGVNKPVIPRAFQSITGPVYRERNFSTVMQAIEFSGLLSALKREGENYSLFVVPDARLRADSSLFYHYSRINGRESESFTAIQKGEVPRTYYMSENDIRFLLLNQVAVETPKGVAHIEFLKTLAGNHLVWDNITGTVSGTRPSINGYNSGNEVVVVPSQISNNADNGVTYSVNAWFSFSTTNIYILISSNFTGFHGLLKKAGLADEKGYKYTFLSDNSLYTVFAPTNEALEAANASSLEGDELIDFLKLHFIVGDLIFTDGKLGSRYYKTLREVPATQSSAAYNNEIFIETYPDIITIPDKEGNIYNRLLVESDNVNMITTRGLNQPGVETNYPNIITTGVVHAVDKALLFEELEVK